MEMLKLVFKVSIVFYALLAILVMFPPKQAHCEGSVCSGVRCTRSMGCPGNCGCVVRPGHEWGSCRDY
jgi:hypothetical protein